MNNDLVIKIVGTLDDKKSVTSINAELAKIETRIKKLNLKIEIDPSVLITLTKIADELKKIGQFKMPNLNPANSNPKQQQQQLQGQRKTLQELTKDYKELNKQIQYHADGNLKSTTTTYRNEKGHGRVVTTDDIGQVINYKDIENIEKFQKEQAKLGAGLQKLAETGKYAQTEINKIGKDITNASTLKDLDTLNNKITQLGKDESFKGNQDRLRESLKKVYDQGKINENQFNSFNNSINSTKNVAEIEKVEKALNKVVDTSNNQSLQKKLTNDSENLLRTHAKTVDKDGVNDLITQIQAISPNSEHAANQLKNLESQLKTYQNNARVAAQHTMTLGDQMKIAFDRTLIWTSVMTGIYGTIQAFQAMTQEILKIDEAMTELKRVMTEAPQTYNEILHESIQLSKDLGNNVHEILAAVNGFARAGEYTKSQLMDLAKTVTVASNVSDLNAEEAMENLISVMNVYKIAASDTMTVVDKMNEVDL